MSSQNGHGHNICQINVCSYQRLLSNPICKMTNQLLNECMRFFELEQTDLEDKAAVEQIIGFLLARFGNQQARSKSIRFKPTVIFLVGSSKQGNRHFASEIAGTLVEEQDNVFAGSHKKLIPWLCDHKGERCVVVIDEIENMKSLNSFELETFYSLLFNLSSVNCSNCIWVFTSSLKENELINLIRYVVFVCGYKFLLYFNFSFAVQFTARLGWTMR